MGLRYARQHIPHRQQALPPMHLTRPPVVSDVTGETGMAMMRARRAGERAPVTLARLRQSRCHHDEATSAKALHGHWRAEHLGAVAQALALDDRSHQQIAECDRQIAAHLETCAEGEDREAWPPVARPRQRPRTRPPLDVRGARPRITGVDLTAMEGMDEPTAWTIISARGLDLGRWPPVKPCTSWLGRCPHHRVSGGKV